MTTLDFLLQRIESDAMLTIAVYTNSVTPFFPLTHPMITIYILYCNPKYINHTQSEHHCRNMYHLLSKHGSELSFQSLVASKVDLQPLDLVCLVRENACVVVRFFLENDPNITDHV